MGPRWVTKDRFSEIMRTTPLAGLINHHHHDNLIRSRERHLVIGSLYSRSFRCQLHKKPAYMPCGQVLCRYASNSVFAGFSNLNLKFEFAFWFVSLRCLQDHATRKQGIREIFVLPTHDLNKAVSMQQQKARTCLWSEYMARNNERKFDERSDS